eukprot:TRINITY_DN38296_c0_g2_i3.p1 TRINITY_DN38296_c0_g2~~TRINITY_DN38296_c0_g2_i3.p1  ORF type:complete len:108 (+),score=26.45 TRINITY_DN38296_c0_g2_i3:146-469(+)
MKSAYPPADVFAACRLAWAKDTKGLPELLLSAGADAEIRNEAGFKAAEEAANGGYVRLAQLLQPERHMSYETFEVKRDSLLSPSGLSKQDMHKGFGTSPFAQSMFAL